MEVRFDELSVGDGVLKHALEERGRDVEVQCCRAWHELPGRVLGSESDLLHTLARDPATACAASVMGLTSLPSFLSLPSFPSFLSSREDERTTGEKGEVKGER